MKFFDFDNPFYRPLWRRIAIVGFSAAWSVFEFAIGSPFWGMLIGGIAAFVFYNLFAAYDPGEPDSDAGKME